MQPRVNNKIGEDHMVHISSPALKNPDTPVRVVNSDVVEQQVPGIIIVIYIIPNPDSAGSGMQYTIGRRNITGTDYSDGVVASLDHTI
jgi:hypothetical protein